MGRSRVAKPIFVGGNAIAVALVTLLELVGCGDDTVVATGSGGLGSGTHVDVGTGATETSAGGDGAETGSRTTLGGSAASGGESSDSEGVEAGTDAGLLPEDFEGMFDGTPTYSRFVRLTHEQWELAVRDLLRLDAAPEIATEFANDPRFSTFSNNEAYLSVSPQLAVDYQEAARTLATRVVDTPDLLALVADGTTDGASFVTIFGRRAFRRPLTDAEETRFLDLFAQGAELIESGDAFADGVHMVIESMLQSPHFLYRTELGPEDERLSGYELAAKVSLAVANTIPSDAMLAAVADGELDTEEGYRQFAQAVLDDPASGRAFQSFYAQLLRLDRGFSAKDSELFPEFTDDLLPALDEADRLFFEHLFVDDLGLRDFLLSPRGYVNEATAPLYDVAVDGPDLRPVEFDAARPGIYTRLGFLARHASSREPEPLRRGITILESTLCSPLPGEPFDPDNTMRQDGQTNREWIESITGEGTCGGVCHVEYINPLGFAFENFDAIGALRETDQGRPVDTSGALRFIDGLQSFADAPELLGLIAESREAHVCYAKHLTEFALARELTSDDMAAAFGLAERSLADASMKTLLHLILSSPSFTTRNGGPQ